MGLFKDLRELVKTSKQLGEQAGVPTGISGMKQMVSQANTMLSDLAHQSADAQRLETTGTVATGIIKALRDTGTTINENPQAEFDVEVTIPGQPPYMVTHRQVVSRLHIPSVQPGSPVALRVDPMDVNNVLIVGI
jgi:hypothetical protein